MPKRSGEHPGTTDERVERAITVDRPAAELYRFWRNLKNLPLIMEGLESVEMIDERRSRWTAGTSDGKRQVWEAEFLEEKENEFLSWASDRGSEVATWGSVSFAPAPGGRGTEVRLILHYQPPPSDRLSQWFWNIFGTEPGDQIQDDLRRFKQLMEIGEVVRSR